MLTLYEVTEKLSRLDELTLLEFLDISSEEIVNKFINRIQDRLEEISEDLEADAEDFRGTTDEL